MISTPLGFAPQSRHPDHCSCNHHG